MQLYQNQADPDKKYGYKCSLSNVRFSGPVFGGLQLFFPIKYRLLIPEQIILPIDPNYGGSFYSNISRKNYLNFKQAQWF